MIKNKEDNVFSILPELDITVSELQHHVAKAPRAKSPALRYASLAVMVLAIGIGLFLDFGSNSAEKETTLINTAHEHTLMPESPSIEKNNDPEISALPAKKTVLRKVIFHSNSISLKHEVFGDSILNDPKAFASVCGKNVFVASTAKIDPMQSVNLIANDIINLNQINKPEAF